MTTDTVSNNNMSRLVLTRKLNERIIIHDETGVLANLKISKIDRNQVRITFEADDSIKIDREEIFEKSLFLQK
jgi:carbon storage regulator CsrA